MLGCTSDSEVLGSRIRDKLTLRNRRLPIDFASMVEGQLVAHDADATLGPPDGDTLDIAYSITPLRAEGAHVGAVLVLRDVTERRAFQDELTRRALHDELTGLPNRRLLLERLDHALTRSSTTGLHHGLLFLDLDRFKLVNDSYGHIIGDKLLIQVAGRLRAGLSPADSVARMSGDEFIVLVEDASDMEAVTSVAERLLQVMQEPFERRRPPHLHVRIDRGRAHPGRPGPRRRTRRDRRGGVRRQGSRPQLLLRLHRRLGRRDARPPRPRGQPSPGPRRERARAALPADRHLRHGPRSSASRPLSGGARRSAASCGPSSSSRSPRRPDSLCPMGRWVLEERLPDRCAVDARPPRAAAAAVSVNLSALQFAQHRLAEDVAETLTTTGLPASQLCLEITETC